MTAATAVGPTRALAQFVRATSFDELPAGVVHEAKRSLLNWAGLAIGAIHHPTIDAALRVIRRVEGKPEATILGRSERTDMLSASFLNGTSSHVFDFDDTHLETIIHPTGPVASALFALAEQKKISGRELINAFVLGVDVECRIGKSVYPSHYDVGWHITATAGVFGAAAAAGKLLGLKEEQLLHAFGLAATQASGLRGMFGTMSKPFHVGHAAKNGLFAALLADEGFTSNTEALEGHRCFATVLSTSHDFSAIYDGLGDRYELSKNAYKPFACGIVIHPTIDGCIQLRNAYGLNASLVDEVEVRVHPLVLELTGKREPRTGLEGKFSVFHSAAVSIIDGEAKEAQYSNERVLDPRVVELRGKVVAVEDDSMAEDEAIVRITTGSGECLEHHVSHALGSLEHPMSDAGLEEKFMSLAVPVVGDQYARELAGSIWELDRVEAVADMIGSHVT